MSGIDENGLNKFLKIFFVFLGQKKNNSTFALPIQGKFF
jgi:hypothetical protein